MVLEILRGGVLSAPHGYTIQKNDCEKLKKNNTKSRLNPYKLTRKARQKQLQSAGLLFPHMLQKIDLCVF